VQSVPITTKVVSSNHVHGEVYSIQHHVIKFVSDLRQVGCFLRVSSTNKTDRHDITEILLKVALSTINQSNHSKIFSMTLHYDYIKYRIATS
jgi:gamma-glutamylcyclotransferase (GGCT)/AIG2-like uncharacterized protein YtfP